MGFVIWFAQWQPLVTLWQDILCLFHEIHGPQGNRAFSCTLLYTRCVTGTHTALCGSNGRPPRLMTRPNERFIHSRPKMRFSRPAKRSCTYPIVTSKHAYEYYSRISELPWLFHDHRRPGATEIAEWDMHGHAVLLYVFHLAL